MNCQRPADSSKISQPTQILVVVLVLVLEMRVFDYDDEDDDEEIGCSFAALCSSAVQFRFSDSFVVGCFLLPL